MIPTNTKKRSGGFLRDRPRWRVAAVLLTGGLTLGLLGHFAYSAAYYVSNLDFGSGMSFADGFESGDLSKWEDGEVELCCDHSGTIVSQGAREGTKALKFSLRGDDPRVAGSKRAELRLKAVDLGQERWYAFSLFVPDEWQTTPELVTVAQWHAVDDRIFGEGGRAPPLRLILNGETWAIASHWDDRLLSGVPFRKAAPRDGASLWTGPLKRGVWTDWVFRVRWSYGDEGLIEVWKDGMPIVQRDGPNTYNDLLGPFFKVGIYIPQWKAETAASVTSRREILFDAIKQDSQPLLPAQGEAVALPRNSDD